MNPDTHAISNEQSLPAPKIPWLLWISLILIQGIVFCLLPGWSGLVIFLGLFSLTFLISSVTNARWTLTILIAVTLLFPVRLTIYFFTPFFGIDLTSFSILVLLYLSWLVIAVKGEAPISSTPMDRWFVALFILAILNCMVSQYTASTVNMWQYFLVTGPVLFMLIHHFHQDGQQVRRTFRLIIAIMVFTGLYMTVEHLLKYNPVYDVLYRGRDIHYDPGAQYFRAVGFCGHPVACSIAFSIILPFAMFGLLRAPGIKKRLLWGLGTVFLMLGAATTYTRGTFITLIVTIVLVLMRSLKTILYVFLVLAIAFVLALNAGLFDFILLRLDPRYLVSDLSLWHRILMFWTSWHVFLDHPILGAGTASMEKLYPLYRHPLDILNFIVVDNQFLSFLYGTGIIGMIIVMGIFAKIPLQILRHRWHEQLPIVRTFRWIGFVSILAFYLNSFNFDSMTWSYSQLLFWTISALLVRLSTLPNRELVIFLKLFGFDENSPEFMPTKNPRT